MTERGTNPAGTPQRPGLPADETSGGESMQWLFEPNPETVFFIGAGLLKNLMEHNGVRPPMAADLFKVAYEYKTFHPLDTLDRATALLPWLETYFRLSEDDLRSRADIPIEEIFTLLDSQARRGHPESAHALTQLEAMLIELLTDFRLRWHVPVKDDWEGTRRRIDMQRAFAEALSDSRSAQITLNYDTFIEETLERWLPTRYTGAYRGTPEQPSISAQDEGTYSLSWYELPLAYGFHLDEVELQHFRLAPGTEFDGVHPPDVVSPGCVSGDRFYNLNGQPLYKRPILKLHGSLNWLTADRMADRPNVRLGRPSFRDSEVRRDAEGHPFIVEFSPLLITPLQQKNYSRWPFSHLWCQAEELLSHCRRLIVIGYSFPPTDFETRRLLREAFAARPVEELVVVNPSDTAQEHAREVVHHRLCVCHPSLDPWLVSEGWLPP